MPELIAQLRDPETGEIIPQPELTDEAALALLNAATITGAELVPWGSNHTFAVAIQAEGAAPHLAIYKPAAGERPLHDFPYGTLHLRERASYLLSAALGWGVVPVTVLHDGPFGEGSLQIYVPSQPEFAEDPAFWGDDTIENERIVLFDHLANNADRKITHLMYSVHGRRIGIDHGLTFHHQPKLRTVMWQFMGRPIRDELLTDLAHLAIEQTAALDEVRALLSPKEAASLDVRIDELLRVRRYPELDPNVNIPWGWW